MLVRWFDLSKSYGLTLTGGNAEGGIACVALGWPGGVTGMANVGGARAGTQRRV